MYNTHFVFNILHYTILYYITLLPIQLDGLIDVVVGSPERIIQHKDKGNLYLSQVTHVIIDEVDTMLTQGFGSDIRLV